MATSASEWELEATRAASLVQEVSYALSERDGLRRTGGNVSDISARIRNQLGQLDRMVDGLDKSLREQETTPSKYRLTGKDITSRREAVKKLASEKAKLRERERMAGGVATASDRAALLGAGDGKMYGRESDLTRDLTAQQLIPRVHMEMKAQEEVLGDMSKSLDTLKTMGKAIGDETDLHLRLLNNLEGEVDKGNANLKRETARIEYVIKDSKTCWLYTAICILLLVLLGLVLARWA